MRIQVKDFMSTPVTTAVEKDSVESVRALMKSKGIHAIPIVEYAKQLPEVGVTIRGIVTATDLSKFVDAKSSIGEVMTSKVHVLHKESNARSAAAMMLRHDVHHIVVMDDGKIIGMVSSLDFVKLVAEHTLD